MKTDILMKGSMVKNNISFERDSDTTHQLQGPFQDSGVIAQHLLPARLRHLQKVKFRLENERIELKVTSLQ